jgi:putative ABC transport system permease protein
MLARASRRYLTRHPWQLALVIIGIAIGVAVVVAVDVATGAAGRAFDLSIQAVSGRATHRIAGSDGFNENVYRALRVDLGVRSSAPMIEGTVELRGETLHLIGIDPFAEAPFRDYVADETGAPVARLLTEPGAVLLAEPTAARLRIKPEERVALKHGANVRLLDYLSSGHQPKAALENLIIADIATAQAILNQIGRLSWIDLKLPADARGERLRARIKRWLPPALRLERAQTRAHALRQMTSAFIINLTAMSWLSLLVGMFLIYSAMTLSVLQRRSLIANLRALGVTQGQIFRLVLSEAAELSGVAVLLGLPLGLALGHGLVELVARTINDLYFTLHVSELSIDPMTFLKGAALGIGGGTLAAMGPAVEAALTAPRKAQPRSRLEARVRSLAPQLAGVGLALMLVGLLLLVPGRSLALGFFALLVLVLGYAFMIPLALSLIVQQMSRPLARCFGPQGLLAARSVTAGLSRTGVAAAALVIAVSATVGVTLMIDSFRSTVAVWLESTLQADVYVSQADGGAQSELAADVVARVSRLAGVEAISVSRWTKVMIGGQPADLHAIQLAPAGRRGFVLQAGERTAVWRAFDNAQAVLVSEPLAYRHKLRVGDDVRLLTSRGERPFKVAGVFYHYSSQQGVVMMRRALYERFWNDHGVSSLGVYVGEQASQQRMLERLRTAARGEGHVLVRSNRELREQSLAVFDRTFEITRVLRWLAILVAAVGILSALMALQLERGREFAVLRAIGFTPGQVARLVMGESALLGAATGLLAMPLGITMSLVLIEVINRRSFGWSMQAMITPEALIQALGLSCLAALLAGLYPAWRVARLVPAEALRVE